MRDRIWSEAMRRLDAAGTCDGDSAALLRFARDRDELAFEQVVRSHGPMVLATCVRVLGNADEADDAFQATFLVLARKAIEGESFRHLGGWLHATASRVALALRRKAQLRRKYEQGARMTRDVSEPVDADAIRFLDEELLRLPEKYRLPVVLCHLKSRSQGEAAEELGVATGTVCKRLHRGREMLRERLARRGVALSAAGLTAFLPAAEAAPTITPALLSSTVRAATGYALGRAVEVGEGTLSAVEGYSAGRSALHRLRWVVLAAAAASGIAFAVGYDSEAQPIFAENRRAAEPVPPGTISPTRSTAFAVTGRVVDSDGQPALDARVALVVPPEPAAAGRWNRNDSSVRTDRTTERGHFHLAVPEEIGSDSDFESDLPYKLVAWAPGSAVAVISRSRGTQEAELRLPKAESIRLRVIDARGRPAAGVQVDTIRIGPVNCEFPDLPVPPFWPRSVVTDASGRATVEGLSRTVPFRLVLRSDRYGLRSLGSEDLAGVADETMVVVGPASPFEVKVVDAEDGRPVAGARVWLSADGTGPGETGFVTQGSTDSRGTFRSPPYGLARFGLLVYPPDQSSYLTIARTIERDPIAPDRQSLTVNLPRGVLVRGRVLDGDRPIAGARVQSVAIPVGGAIANPDVRTGSHGVAMSGSDGRFAFGVPSGRSALLVHAPGANWISRPVTLSANGLPTPYSLYAHASKILDLTVDTLPDECEFKPMLGRRVRVRVETSAGKSPQSGHLTCRCQTAPLVAGGLRMFPIVDGVAELPGCDPTRDYPVLAIDSHGEEAAVAVVPGNTDVPERNIRLDRGGAAELRFSGAATAANLTVRLVALLPPDAPCGESEAEYRKLPASDGTTVCVMRPESKPGPYPGGVEVVAKFPGLVPGMRYRVLWSDGTNWQALPEFVVRAGECIRLPGVVVPTK